jgi:hypothetical protein
MPKFANGAPARLRKLLTRVSKQQSAASPDTSPFGAFLDNPYVWNSLAKAALTLDANDENHGPAKRTFEVFGLDWKDPMAWRIVVMEFSSLLFGKPKPAGRHPSWTVGRYIELLNEIRARRDRNRALSRKQACARIARDKLSPEYFRRAGTGGLCKAEERARRDPQVFRTILTRAVAYEMLSQGMTDVTEQNVRDVLDAHFGTTTK